VTYRRACNFGNCIEVEFTGDEVHIRDSKNPDGLVLRFTRDEWEPFELGVMLGEFHWEPRSEETR
jgi:hypothetical protein